MIVQEKRSELQTNHCALFCSGNDEDYLNIVIKDGGISVMMKVTTGKLDLYIKPNRVRFDDYRWHKVVIHRRIKEVSNQDSGSNPTFHLTSP